MLFNVPTKHWAEAVVTKLIFGLYLFNGVQRGSYGNEGHEHDGGSVVVILFETPQDHTEELEDVERIQDLYEDKENDYRGFLKNIVFFSSGFTF